MDFQRYMAFSDRIGAVGDTSQATIKYSYSEVVEKEGKGGSPSVLIHRAGASLESDADRAYGEFAILKRERVNAEGENEGAQVDIQCEVIQDALHSVFRRNYPGGIHANPIVFRKPYYPLFHGRHKIRELAARESNSDEQRQRLEWLTDFMSRNFTTLEKLQAGFVAKGFIEFKHLPLIFEAGSIVVGVVQGEVDQTVKFDEPLKTEHRECFLFHDISDELENKAKGGKYMELNVFRWGFDGSKYGPTKVRLRIKEFSSPTRITDLECYPLSQLEPGERNTLVLELIKRGKNWCDYVKAKKFKYEGVGHAMTRSDWSWEVKKSSKNMSGRVILDHPSFIDAYPELSTPLYEKSGDKMDSAPPAFQEPLASAEIWKISDDIIPWDSLWGQDEEDGKYVPSDAQALLCPAASLGYSLATKEWGLFDVSRLREMDWAPHRINDLQIKHLQKMFLNDLISGYYAGRPAGDEVTGKDDGLIFLLHGPPGCGKTLTAELVAEGNERALIRITFADLGERLPKFEMNLVALFKLAVRSGAMVLIDEADAFLAKRQGGSGGYVDYQHNAVVSIFLRQLECFTGIMFLTTNHNALIDPAISSRVIPLQYPRLSAESKANIWMGQLRKERGDLPEEEIGLMCEELATAYPSLDGREIKKLARLARTISRGRKTVVSRDVIREIYELAHKSEESPPNHP